MNEFDEWRDMLANTGMEPNLIAMHVEAARAMGMSEEVIAECQDENGVVWFDARKYRRE